MLLRNKLDGSDFYNIDSQYYKNLSRLTYHSSLANHQIFKQMGRLWIALMIVCLYSCGEVASSDTDRFANCLYEAPTPIFSDQLRSIEQHRFKITAATGVEEIVFNSGLELAIYQRGCDQLEQNFKFKIHQTVTASNTRQWIEEAGEYFYFLGTLDEQYLPLYEWGKLLIENATQISLNQPFEVYPGFLITVQQSKERGHTVLQVTLSQSA